MGEETQARLKPFTAWRRNAEDLCKDLTDWIKTCLLELCALQPQGKDSTLNGPPSKATLHHKQRMVKVRSAVEHLVSINNIKGCRANGSTVTSCQWIPAEARSSGNKRPAWPASYFCGAPQLKRLNVTEGEVLSAACESAMAVATIQEGEDGARVKVVSGKDGGDLVAHVDLILPEQLCRKLNCPNPAEVGWELLETPREDASGWSVVGRVGPACSAGIPG